MKKDKSNRVEEAFKLVDYYLMEKFEKIPLTSKEREECKKRFGKVHCSFAKNKDGQFFAYTHRARTKFYPSIASLPKEKVRFVSSTA